MRIRPAQVLRVYPRGWGGSLSGLGQCTDPESGLDVPCGSAFPSSDYTIPTSNTASNLLLQSLATTPNVTTATPPPGYTPAQWAALTNAGMQSTIGITRALSTPSLTPGTNVIYNPATGQFYNPQTGQVVSPGGPGIPSPLYAGVSTISPGLIIGVLLIGGLVLMGSRK